MHTLPTFRVKIQRGVHLIIIPRQRKAEPLTMLRFYAIPHVVENLDAEFVASFLYQGTEGYRAKKGNRALADRSNNRDQ